MNITKTDAGIWVDVKEELPDENFIGTVKTNYYRTQKCRYAYKEWDKDNFMFKDEVVTHWLKPMNQVYVLSEQQIKDLIGKSFDAGMLHEYEKHFGAVPPITENKEQFIQSLFIK